MTTMDEALRMTPEQLGEALRELRTSRFGGMRNRAYTAAGVNSETWARAEAGKSLKEYTRLRIIARMFEVSHQIVVVGVWQNDTTAAVQVWCNTCSKVVADAEELTVEQVVDVATAHQAAAAPAAQ